MKGKSTAIQELCSAPKRRPRQSRKLFLARPRIILRTPSVQKPSGEYRTVSSQDSSSKEAVARFHSCHHAHFLARALQKHRRDGWLMPVRFLNCGGAVLWLERSSF